MRQTQRRLTRKTSVATDPEESHSSRARAHLRCAPDASCLGAGCGVDSHLAGAGCGVDRQSFRVLMSGLLLRVCHVESRGIYSAPYICVLFMYSYGTECVCMFV